MEPLDYLERFLYRVSGAQATVEAPRCLREHSGLSECDLCVKSCPVQSIDLRGGVHVLSHCTGCGVCLAVCPVSAFDLSGAAPGQLLSRAASVLRRGGSLSITCERSADVASADLVLPCLAGLDETVVLGVLALGAQKLSLTRGPCGACPYTEAVPRYRRTLDRMRRWSRAIPGAAERIVEVGEGEESPEKSQASKTVGPDRRAFFAWVRSEGMQLMASVLDDFSEGLHGRRSVEGVPLPLRNRLLPHILKKLGVGEDEIPYDPEGPCAELLLDEIKCNGCEACVRICPTKAIVRGEDEEVFRLTLEVNRCVNCALCLDACIPNALTYRQGLSLSAVMGKPKVLVEKPYRRCGRCEARFLWSEGVESEGFCSTCHFLADLERSPTIPGPDGAGGAAPDVSQREKEQDVEAGQDADM